MRLFLGDNPHATVAMVRAARIPSMAAINPNVDAELEAIVRKALARDPADRFRTAADYGDALSHYLFAKGLKVTSRNVAAAVREVKIAKQRAASPKQTLIQALIMDEVNKMTSLVADEIAAEKAPVAAPSELIDTKDWVSDLLDD
jgi:serine/threonine-protein kinase